MRWASLSTAPDAAGVGRAIERLNALKFELEALEVLQRDVAERFGFHRTGHVLELLGTCESCRAIRA